MKNSLIAFVIALNVYPLGASAQEVAVPQSPAAVTTQASTPEPGQIGLDELVHEALSKNPAIQAQAKRVEALRLRVPQAKSLPDPEVSVGWMGNITPFSVQNKDPSSYRGITAMEEFPYPGKLKLRGQIADREAESARWD